jgi:hypothetical protein
MKIVNPHFIFTIQVLSNGIKKTHFGQGFPFKDMHKLYTQGVTLG